MSGQGLTEEQKKKIEESRQKAIARRLEKQSPVKCYSASQLTLNVYSDRSNVEICISPSQSTDNNCGVDLHRTLNPGASHSQMHVPNLATSKDNKWVIKSAAPASQNYAASKEKILKSTGPKLSGKCVFVGNDKFTVEIDYSAPLIQYFKQLKTRCYDTSTKFWSFKIEEYDTLMKGVQNFRPDIEIEGLPRWILRAFSPDKKDVDVVPSADLSHVDQKLVQALLPFQLDGVNYAIHCNGRLLIADDMGLGKTLQAICIACYYRKEWPLLIVSPSSVRFDWAQQICKWLPSVAPCDINVIVTGKASATSGMINIVSYDMLSKKTEELTKAMFRIIIMDESHFLKNSKTVRTKAAMPLLKNAKRVLLLSGTPALSRPIELYSQISAVCPQLFKFHDFGVRYCNAKKMQWGWDYSSSSNMVELQVLLEKRIMIRRQKKDVLSQLPAKYRQVIMLDPHSVHKHKDLKNANKVMNNGKLKGINKQGALLEYFHETCKAKQTAVRDYILDLIEAEKKFLVFGHHKEMLDCIEDGIKAKASNIEYIRIDGRTTSEQRNFFCTKFQTCDSYRVAILSITAANAGLNLSAANIVVFAELFWNPGILVQAEDRAHRIGQQDSVSVQYLVAQHTADDHIWPLVQSKLDILSKAGLAKDDFADTDTTRLTDKTQLTLLDMLNAEFITDAIPDMPEIDNSMTPDISVDVEGVLPEKVDVKVVSASPLHVKINVVPQGTKTSSTRQGTPRKSPRKSVTGDWTRTIPTKQAIMSSQYGALTQGNHTPSKRQASITTFFERTPPKKMLRLDDDVATQLPQNCGGIIKQKCDSDANLATREDVYTEMPWLDDDFASDCFGNDTLSVARCDESSNKTSQESKTGGDRSPCVTRQDSKTEGDRSPWVTSQESITGGDRSPCVTSQESKTGDDRSPCVTSQESARSNTTPIASHGELTWLQDLDWDDEI